MLHVIAVLGFIAVIASVVADTFWEVRWAVRAGIVGAAVFVVAFLSSAILAGDIPKVETSRAGDSIPIMEQEGADVWTTPTRSGERLAFETMRPDGSREVITAPEGTTFLEDATADGRRMETVRCGRGEWDWLFAFGCGERHVIHVPAGEVRLGG